MYDRLSAMYIFVCFNIFFTLEYFGLLSLILVIAFYLLFIIYCVLRITTGMLGSENYYILCPKSSLQYL